MSFHDSVALVTGAAGGIGRAVTLALAQAGASVAALDQDETALKAMDHEVQGTDLRIRTYVADVSIADEITRVVSEVEQGLGPVDHLVNCAGILRPAAALELTETDWRQTFAVNVDGIFHTSTTVARAMVRRGRGAIVTVASNASGVPRFRMAAYGASKAAATAFTKNLGLELAGQGIRCNIVAPGSTDTSMLRSLWTDETGPAQSLNGSLAEFRVGIPLKRLASPQDVAESVLFLLSDQARHITMHELLVDGGAAL